ncbi:4-hydroxybenzoate polyprenyltransferase [Clostridium beijerinckii]|uniref:UbiA prenyltransferase family protein n=1 Tax=Clostridium beijerinckii TaxID=1520 RepID=UPI0015709FE4|nr:UbiA prenyltransferase family protein [Clostridium beijerinckii]NRT37502.1 4-hydroxybenzoate polyprenyltransferase [Clostridium beijerinckii]NRT48756.1 4-hydroxybenzoate polyprenyltransferase [Clostridium beijerinckii]NRZ22948.1 4-hydroxybenzoate polyprenyltransferase [Clostridium beijerinckii]
MKKYLKLMRVHHYLKNILVFLPLVFSQNLFNVDLLLRTILGFCSFSILSSIVYIINDIQDVEKDRKHSTKCNRPIASGAVSIKSAYILSILIAVIGIILNYFACGINIASWIFIMLYLTLNFLYSMGLKNVPIIDITILVSGFLLRVLYGGAVSSIEVSKWLYLTVISMSFYLGLGKRRNELTIEGNKARKVLKYYNHEFLDKNMYMCLGLTIIFYSLWCVDINTIARYTNDKFAWTVPLVMLICMKYSLNIEGNSDGDPVSVILKDKVLIFMILLYIIIVLLIIYM